MCFLMETCLDNEGFDKIIVKQPNAGGGLALLWKKEVGMDLINYSPNHILMKVTKKDGFV